MVLGSGLHLRVSFTRFNSRPLMFDTTLCDPYEWSYSPVAGSERFLVCAIPFVQVVGHEQLVGVQRGSKENLR